jgi:hypothetical protein
MVRHWGIPLSLLSLLIPAFLLGHITPIVLVALREFRLTFRVIFVSVYIGQHLLGVPVFVAVVFVFGFSSFGLVIFNIC